MFGPVADGNDDVEAVLGLLVEFGATMRLWDLPGLHRDLWDLLGIKVEIVPDVPGIPEIDDLRDRAILL